MKVKGIQAGITVVREQAFNDVGDLFAYICDDIRSGAFEMELLEKYRTLFNENRRGSSEQVAYYGIVKALESSDPPQELEKRINKAHNAIAENDQRKWNSREGYRGYYNKQIALHKQAMSEVTQTLNSNIE